MNKNIRKNNKEQPQFADNFRLPMGNSLENASLVIPWCHLIPHNPSYECSGHRDTGKYMVKQATAFSFKDSVCSFRSEILDISVHLHQPC